VRNHILLNSDRYKAQYLSYVALNI